MQLKILNDFPKGLLNVQVTDLYRLLGGPTLIHIEGKQNPPLFICLLLHGNEHTGFLAIQKLLKKYIPHGKKLPRSLSLFIGNVEAAQKGHRRLDHQPDYNRIWHGDPSPEGKLVFEVIQIMKKRRIFASIDIHNNSGENPHYSCIAQMNPQHMRLALLFKRTVIYFRSPTGIQSIVFSDFCPAITIECGFSGDAHGIDLACNYLETALKLKEIPNHEISPNDIDFYETMARIRLPKEFSFTFAREEEPAKADVIFIKDLDSLNFSKVPLGTVIAHTKPGKEVRIIIEDRDGLDIGDEYVEYKDGLILTKKELIPSHLTCDEEVIKQDCLGYFMKRKKIS